MTGLLVVSEDGFSTGHFVEFDFARVFEFVHFGGALSGLYDFDLMGTCDFNGVNIFLFLDVHDLVTPAVLVTVDFGSRCASSFEFRRLCHSSTSLSLCVPYEKGQPSQEAYHRSDDSNRYLSLRTKVEAALPQIHCEADWTESPAVGIRIFTCLSRSSRRLSWASMKLTGDADCFPFVPANSSPRTETAEAAPYIPGCSKLP